VFDDPTVVREGRRAVCTSFFTLALISAACTVEGSGGFPSPEPPGDPPEAGPAGVDAAADRSGSMAGCQNTGCAGDTPICLASSCVECMPAAQRCGPEPSLETCSGAGSWARTSSCQPPGRCHANGKSAASCLALSLLEPSSGDSRRPFPPFPFRWAIGNQLEGVRYCNVLMLDKGTMVRDGLGEEAFYVGENLEARPALDPLFYGRTTFSWAVLSVACQDPDAVCRRACRSSRDCAHQGVLKNLPCQGISVWSEERTLSLSN
jgi:hypothetical protein